MKKITLSTIALAIMLSASSCTQRLIDFTVISSKNVSLKIDKSTGKRVKGSSIQFLAIGVSIKDAMDKALSSAGPDCDLLVDGVVRVVNYPFVAGYTVEGTAISTSKIKAQLGEAGFAEWCKTHNILDPEKAGN